MSVRRVLGLAELDRGRPALPVGELSSDARLLAQDLIDTMRASPACVGLAAPQIGVPLRAFVLDVSGHRKARTVHGELVLFDPELLEAQETEVAREGCMSVPDLTGDVARATRIVLRGRDVAGAEKVIRTDAFEARAVLHELDHLDGLVFLDRLAGPGALHARRVYR
ncbi:MAG: formylmethionine deformylase [Acidimicrobiaceae bacterium]|nr:formylmethionine deformylase [Acidimicrobiaceae bacterium]